MRRWGNFTPMKWHTIGETVNDPNLTVGFKTDICKSYEAQEGMAIDNSNEYWGLSLTSKKIDHSRWTLWGR
jgi:hypothetical protein